MTNTEALRQCIDQSGYKMQYIADQVGISRFALNQKIENKTQFKSEEIKTICNVLGISSLKERDRIFFA